MSGVVLRCPSCGTSQGSPGECEACREAAVRYFCANHSPGRWLEGATCTACGSAFGDRSEVPPSRPPSPPPRAPASPRRPDPWGARPPAAGYDAEREKGAAAARRLIAILTALAEAGRGRRGADGVGMVRPRRRGGCLGGALVTMLVLFALMWLGGGGLLQLVLGGAY